MAETAPIFKGATRPACLMGVPIVPFVMSVGATALVALWTWLPLALLVVPEVLVMRAVTKEDDQKFRLLFLHVRHRLAGNRNVFLWGGATVFRAASSREGVGSHVRFS